MHSKPRRYIKILRHNLTNMKRICTILLSGLFILNCQAQKKNIYTSNRAPLTQNAFIELPLGSIQAEGWLKERLIRQKNGLTGHLDEIYTLVMGETNGWLGGQGDQWERGPYWIDGLLPLAYILNDQTLKDKVNKWVEWSLKSQREDGFFGPAKDYPNDIPGIQRDNCDDWWPRMVMLKILQQHYSATGDQRVITFMTKYFQYQLKELPSKPLDFRTFWAKHRAGDNLMVVFWLYNITGDQNLLKLADIIYSQSMDFLAAFNTKNWWADGNMHCVNLAQGIKTPAIYSQYKNKETILPNLKSGFEDIRTNLGYPHGGFGGDEGIHGNKPTQGTELCTIVEYMFSLEQMFQISGDIDYADQIERLAFNALPAQSDDEYMNRQYFQQTNQVSVTRFRRNFDTEHEGTDIVFGLLNGYPCCTSNMHQGFPKFLQNLWYATQDNGLAAALYSPSSVKAKVGDGTEVIIEELTNYPFSENIHLSVTPKKKTEFPLYLRIPAWCKNPVISVNAEPVNIEIKNGMVCINRTWNKKDEITIDFPMSINISHWYERSGAVERGPLVYALKMNEKRSLKTFEGNDINSYGKTYWEITSEDPWNFALINWSGKELNDHYQVNISKDVALFPWNVTNDPIQIRTVAKRVPNWVLYNQTAGPQPSSMAYQMYVGQKDSITLIPYGCTKLRIAEFPMTGN